MTLDLAETELMDEGQQLVEEPDRRGAPGQWDLHLVDHLEYCLN